MLAQPGGGTRGWRVALAAHGRSEHAVSTPHRMPKRLQATVLRHERILERLREIVDGCGRNGTGKDFELLRCRALSELSIEHFGDERPVTQPVRETAEPLVLAPFRAAQLLA
jgi:hypothetical protein